MIKNFKWAEQLELDSRPRKIPDWNVLRVSEKKHSKLSRGMFRDRFEQSRANQDQEQGGSKDE